MADASHPKTGASHKRVGSVVRGKYRIDSFVATGTMANIYAATHRNNGARVALKILHPQLAEDTSLTERFKREGYFANSIGHPGVVRTIDDDVTEDGCAFLVMELLEGESLDERRRRKGGKLSLAYVLPVADALLEVLAAAHSRGVVHRDLKPDNVFVTKNGDVKVLDFGLARFADGKQSSDMTAVGMVLGTPAYMPPEQALGRREDVDAQSDLWAVGATLFVVLSGEAVHAGGDAKAKLIATARTAARPLREAAPDVPRAVASVIDRALSFHKKERWPDADAMREALRWARMSVEDRPSEQQTSAPELPQASIAVPTRRLLVDDEPTLAREAPRASSAPPKKAGAMTLQSPGSVPESRDFLTSAPPITLRDAPKPAAGDSGANATVSSNEPIFSLRRAKEGEESPSTERIPKAAKDDLGSEGKTKVPSAESVPHARAMPAYDPADTMGGDPPSSAESIAKSIEVNMSFTRPMAAMVMPPEYEAPRPAAGVPAVSPAVTTLPGFPPAADATAPQGSQPPNQASSAPPVFNSSTVTHPGGFSSAPPPLAMAATDFQGTAQHMPSFPPPGSMPPPAPFNAVATSPSLRVQAQQAHQAQMAHAGTLPLAAASSRPSLPPEDPGPLLASIVKPRSPARIIIPVVLGVIALAAVFVVLRTRAANARAIVAAKTATATASASAEPPPTTNVVTNAPSAPGGPSATIAPVAPPPPAPVANVPDSNPTPAGATAAVADPPPKPKRPKRPRRPKPPPVASAEGKPDDGPTSTAPAMTATTPPDPPDPSSLPQKDPDPKAPAPETAP